MAESTATGINMIGEDEATGEVADIYQAIRQEMQTPYVPNWLKILGESPAALKIYMGIYHSFYAHVALPQSLVAMICFTIAEKSNCTYCAALHELTCRTLGVDDETLKAIASDLGEVNPERIRAIIEFAIKAAKHSKELTKADYDVLRDHGITNDEILQILMVTGLATMNDMLADALKLPVDGEVVSALSP